MPESQSLSSDNGFTHKTEENMIGKQRILIVDDDENIAELISLYLTKECFDTK